MKLYFKQEKKAKNIEELIIYGFSGYNTYRSFKKTYFDPELKKQQCHEASRSFEDLLSICRAYFPRTTKKTISKIII